MEAESFVESFDKISGEGAKALADAFDRHGPQLGGAKEPNGLVPGVTYLGLRRA